MVARAELIESLQPPRFAYLLRLLLCAIWASLLTSAASSVSAEAPAAAGAQPQRVLRIGTKQIPPFAIKQQGEWRGVSIALWREFADEMCLDY